MTRAAAAGGGRLAAHFEARGRRVLAQLVRHLRDVRRSTTMAAAAVAAASSSSLAKSARAA